MSLSQDEMHAVPIQVTASVASPRGKGKSSRRNPHHDLLMWALIALLALSPLPLASNRPILWAISAAGLGLVGLVYVFNAWRAGSVVRTPVGLVLIPAVLQLTVCLYLVVQALPLGLGGTLALPADPSVKVDLQTISIMPTATWLMLLRQLSYAIFGLLILQVVARESRRDTIYRSLIYIIGGYAVWGLISLRLGDTILGMPKWAYQQSATSTFVNRNSFATFLAFGICLATACLARALVVRPGTEHGRGRVDSSDAVRNGVALVILFAAVLATQSRMGLFVSAAGALTVAIATLLAAKISRPAAIATLLVAAIGLTAGFTLLGGGLFERLGTLEQSAVVRYDFYLQIIELIKLRPWTGWGGGTFDQAFPLIHQLPVNPDVIWDKGHNTYLTLWTELGIIFGTLPMLVYLLIFFRILIALVQRRGSWLAQAVAVGVLVVGAVHSLVDFSLEIQADTLVFVALVAIGLSSTFAQQQS